MMGISTASPLSMSDRKSQTTKDLAKPWAALPLPRSQRPDAARLDEVPRNTQKHSAKTTFLLDDSPLKAHLQPWNHLCIREYVNEMRQVDVAVRNAEVDAVLVKAQSTEPDSAVVDDDKKKRKRDNKAKKALAKREAAKQQSSVGKYDRTLLAVIGVLDAIKTQSNVAAWMRSGGLIHTEILEEQPDDYSPGPSGRQASVSRESSIQSSTGSPPKKRRISGEAQQEIEADTESERPSSPLLPPSSQTILPSSPISEKIDLLSEDAVDAQASSGIPMSPSAGLSGPPKNGDPELWFENDVRLEYWASKGEKALHDLEIDVVSGIIGSHG